MGAFVQDRGVGGQRADDLAGCVGANGAEDGGWVERDLRGGWGTRGGAVFFEEGVVVLAECVFDAVDGAAETAAETSFEARHVWRGEEGRGEVVVVGGRGGAETVKENSFYGHWPDAACPGRIRRATGYERRGGGEHQRHHGRVNQQHYGRVTRHRRKNTCLFHGVHIRTNTENTGTAQHPCIPRALYDT